ncbi:hypothetical protein ACH5RR_021164 [Cinchona calisaya]|uniref:DUF659 domain-containing protein n=1 Tax=Cinchona calisaya TaxID=153742 RepID=A0ABD2ZJS9_9GENT
MPNLSSMTPAAAALKDKIRALSSLLHILTHHTSDGINRMKQHLAGEKGSVVSCTKVTPKVRHAILGSLKETAQKAKEKRGDFEEENPFGRFMNEYDGDEVQEIPHLQAKGVSFNEVETSPVNSPFYQNAIDHIAAMGHGYKSPSYHALRVPLLRDAKKEVQLVIDSLRSNWIETGCTIMGDSWKDSRQRLLINFLVYCNKGISFIKSVDASDIETNAQILCNLFVEIVGPKNVVHIVTDNASNYKAAEGLLTEKYPTFCWSPCTAHCGEMHDVKALVTLASTVIVFVYNHRIDRLEHQRLNDLVHVYYNLHLQHRTNHQKRSYDPIDYESIDKKEFWVVEEEPNGELDYDELEAKLEELPVDDVVECSNSQKVGDDEEDDKIGKDVDLELFQRRGFGRTDEDDEWLN